MTDILSPDIKKALERFKERSTAYAKAEQYYRGQHNLAYATDKFENAFGKLFREFAMNLCPAIVDAVRDKLVVTEFRVEEGEGSIADEAWKIWQANRMGIRSGEIHKEAARSGDAYAIVWVNPEGRVTIYPNKAATCTVFYDDENPGKILWAAKLWKREDKQHRLNLFYQDRIERYITRRTKKDDRTSSIVPEAKEFELFEEPIKNPYGIVPVFHFANNGDIGAFGISELTNAIPVQDALNKSVLDMMVAMEFAAYRQRWAAGIEIDYDDDGKPIAPFKAGISHLWMTENPEAKFGDFQAADLEKFLKVKESFRVDIACVTGTPIYYFMQTSGDFPSGEALRKAETRFVNKIRDRQESFGAVWEDVMAFALKIEQKGTVSRLFTEWEDPAPLSEREELENLILKADIGVTDETLLMEAGYGQDEIAKMIAEKEAAREAMAKSFNAGEIGGGGTE